jgi:competence protein ComEA
LIRTQPIKENIMSKALLALAFCLSLPLCAGGEAPKKPININTATVTELMQLPKVGAKTAERIVSFRKQHGGFRRLEEIMDVKGIGEKSFAKLKPYLTLGPGVVSSHS